MTPANQTPSPLLAAIDDVADQVGQLHSRLTEIVGLDSTVAAAVAHAAQLLDEADEVLTRAYCDCATKDTEG